MDSSKSSCKAQDSWRNQRAVREGPQAHLVPGQHRPSTLSVWPGDLQGKTQIPQEEVTSSILFVVLRGHAIADTVFQTWFCIKRPCPS